MKNLKYLFGALCILFTTFSLSSCLNDDSEDYSISKEDYSQYMAQMVGMYSGKMYFWNDTITLTSTKKTKIDSLEHVSSYVRGVNDSTVTVAIPAKYLGKNIKNTEENKILKEAMDKAPVQSVSFKYYLNYAKDGGLFFYIVPTTVNTINVNYNNENHKVELTWYGSYDGTYYKGKMYLTCYLANIKVDGKEVWKGDTSSSNTDIALNPRYEFSLSK